MSDHRITDEHRLFDAACTGRLDEPAHAELQQLLRESPEARQRYLDYTALHADLFGAVRTARVRERVEQMLDEERTPAAVAALSARRSPSRRRPVITLAAALATAAALLLILRAEPEQVGDVIAANDNAVEVLDGVRADEEIETWPGLIARINRVEKVRWEAEARQFREDELVAAGQSVAIDAGLVEIEFRQGAVVVLEGPAHLIASDANSASLLSGKLAAVAPPWATGFRVDTPGVDVVDHGTEFAVSVSGDDKNAQVNVVVTEGEVEVLKDEQLAGGRRLKAGEGVQSADGEVAEGDDAEARQLTRHLPDRPELKNAVVVADRWADWSPGEDGEPNREGGWRYYTNTGGAFGNPASYEELVWHAETWAFRPADLVTDPWMNQFVRVHREGGHPGKGHDQIEDEIDRYSITGFVVPEGGVYRIEAGWLERRWARRWDRDEVMDIAIHVNNEPIVMREMCNRDCFVSFRQELGKLAAGDMVYVGVGPNGADFNDKFRWGFVVVRETEPPGEESQADEGDLAAN